MYHIDRYWLLDRYCFFSRCPSGDIRLLFGSINAHAYFFANGRNHTETDRRIKCFMCRGKHSLYLNCSLLVNANAHLKWFVHYVFVYAQVVFIYLSVYLFKACTVLLHEKCKIKTKLYKLEKFRHHSNIKIRKKHFSALFNIFIIFVKPPSWNKYGWMIVEPFYCWNSRGSNLC